MTGPNGFRPQRDSVWRETGIIARFLANGAVHSLAHGHRRGLFRSLVAEGSVYVTDRVLPEGKANPSNPFARGVIPGMERIVCLDESSGKILWHHDYDCPYTAELSRRTARHAALSARARFTRSAPRATCSALTIKGRQGGSVSIISKRISTSPRRSGDSPAIRCSTTTASSASPAIELHRRGVRQGDDGHEIRRALTAKEPGYSAPVINNAAGKRQLIILVRNRSIPRPRKWPWPAGPSRARPDRAWPFPRRGRPAIFCSLPSFYNGSMMLKLDAAKPAETVAWHSERVSEKNTDMLHCTR